MRDTPYKHYQLYEPDASPDLTETGEYNSAVMAIDADMHTEAQARADADTALGQRIDTEASDRKSADTALGQRIDTEASDRKSADTALGQRIDTEVSDRKSADTALGKRIDNAEAEISANSADLTGIKGLTYGSDAVHLVEESNGAYSSPALTEIEHDISDAKQWGNIEGKPFNAIGDGLRNAGGYLVVNNVGWGKVSDKPFVQLGSSMKSENGYLDVKQVGWDKVSDKPFNTLGNGLDVTVDGQVCVMPAGTSQLGGVSVSGRGLRVWGGDNYLECGEWAPAGILVPGTIEYAKAQAIIEVLKLSAMPVANLKITFPTADNATVLEDIWMTGSTVGIGAPNSIVTYKVTFKGKSPSRGEITLTLSLDKSESGEHKAEIVADSEIGSISGLTCKLAKLGSFIYKD